MAKAASLARRSKPLSSILTTRFHCHAVADMPDYASSLAVNLSFSQLAGAKAVGSKRWGSISFSEMEKLECFGVGFWVLGSSPVVDGVFSFV